MRRLFASFVLIVAFCLPITSAEAVLDLASFQVHNPVGPSDVFGNENNAKSQFAIRNDSEAGVKISSILWTFASPVFIDSASGNSGFGSFKDFTVSPAATYGGLGAGEFEINVLANSDTLTGYAGPAHFADGATSLLLSFNSFDSGESFGFLSDLDTANNLTGRVGNSDFNGSKTKVTFSNGYVAEYLWVLPNNNGRTFYAQGVGGQSDDGHPVPEPASVFLFATGLVGSLLKKIKYS